MSIGILGLTNNSSLMIEVAEDGESLTYKFQGGSAAEEAVSADIDFQYDDDASDEDDEEIAPGFQVPGGAFFFLSEFIRMAI